MQKIELNQRSHHLDDASRVLVLNKNWQPVDVVSIRSAFSMTFASGKEPARASFLCHRSFMSYEWDDWKNLSVKNFEVIRTSQICVRIPEIILLTSFDRKILRAPSFSRKNVFLRDGHQCQYCGSFPKGSKLTLDHVVPKAMGGSTTWTNCVTSCFRCNHKKEDKLLHQSGLVLRHLPKKPEVRIEKLDQIKHRPSWMPFLQKNR